MKSKLDVPSVNDILIIQTRGIYYIYINANFYCSCDTFNEVKEEIDNITCKAYQFKKIAYSACIFAVHSL